MHGALTWQGRRHAAARTDEYLYHQLIPYLGNKRKLLPLLQEAIERTGVAAGTFVDFFAGSGVVSRLAKSLGYRVVANDWEPYARELNGAYIDEADEEEIFAIVIAIATHELDDVPAIAGRLAPLVRPLHPAP